MEAPLHHRPSITRIVIATALAVVSAWCSTLTPTASATPIDLDHVRTVKLRVPAGLSPGEGTWIATVRRKVPVRSEPRRNAPIITRLDRRGASSRRNSVMATGAYRTARNGDWVRIQLESRPNERVGWVPAKAVVLRRSSLRLVMHLRARRLVLMRGDEPIRVYRAGMGRPDTPTPVGEFAIWDTWATPPEWRVMYGSHIIALTAHSTVLRTFMGGDGRVAIHGGGRIGRVGRPSSNGCVIVAPDTLAYLARTLPPGTSVTVLDG